MNIAPLQGLAATWREECSVLQRRGAQPQADALESCADDLDASLRAWSTEELTIAEAAKESGYTEDHLRALVRSGRLPNRRPPGSGGRIRISRRDLPRRPSLPEPRTDLAVVTELASELVG